MNLDEKGRADTKRKEKLAELKTLRTALREFDKQKATQKRKLKERIHALELALK